MLYHKVPLVHLFIDPPHPVLLSFLASEPVEITGRPSSPSRCPPVGALSPPERSPRPRPSIIRSHQWNRTTSVTLRPPFLWLRQSGCSTQWHTRASPGPSWRTRAAISRKHGRAPTTRSPATSQRTTVSVAHHGFVARQSSTASVGPDEPTWSLSSYEQHQQDRHASSKWPTAPARSRSWLCPSNANTLLPATWPST
jgi:hypothetical protein